MNLQDRIIESEQKFEQEKQKREEHIRLADESLIEMNKLQGEWRVLQELSTEEKGSDNSKLKSQVNRNKAATVEVVPEGEKA